MYHGPRAEVRVCRVDQLSKAPGGEAEAWLNVGPCVLAFLLGPGLRELGVEGVVGLCAIFCSPIRCRSKVEKSSGVFLL